jgi:hypothetical protein
VTKIKKEEHLRRESIGSLGRKSAILATTSMKTSILSDSADDDEEEYELEGEDEEDDDDDDDDDDEEEEEEGEDPVFVFGSSIQNKVVSKKPVKDKSNKEVT